MVDGASPTFVCIGLVSLGGDAMLIYFQCAFLLSSELLTQRCQDPLTYIQT